MFKYIFFISVSMGNMCKVRYNNIIVKCKTWGYVENFHKIKQKCNV